MKKVLFATTAIVASAGVASADVTLSGSAEMGIVGGDGIETQFWTDIDVAFTLSGETDNGLTFGATIDLDEVGDDCTATTQTLTDSNGDTVSVTACTGGDPIGQTGPGEEHSVFISGDFGRLTMGDTDGAMDWALAESALGGDINDSSTAHAGNSFLFSFTGGSALDGINDGQVARYEYSFGDFAFAVSAELDDAGVFDPTFGIGATYATTMGDTDLSVGVAYQSADGGPVDFDAYGISVQAALANGLTLAGEYQSFDFGPGADLTHIGVGASYSWDALTVAVNYGQWDATGTTLDMDGFGISAAYDLGGGAVVQAGYGSSDLFGTAADTDSFSFGLAMSF